MKSPCSIGYAIWSRGGVISGKNGFDKVICPRWGDVRPGLGLCFVLFQVICPLRIIFNGGLEPELSSGEHSGRQVQVCLALVACSVQDRTIIEDCSWATSSQSLPQRGTCA